MAVTNISLLPPAMSRQRPDTFSAESDTYFAALEQQFAPQMRVAIANINTTEAAIDADRIAAANAASSAAASATTATQAAGAALWNSGQTYALGTVAVSRVNFQAYRKRTTTTGGTVDPANNTTDWRIIASGSNTFVPVVVTGSEIDLRLGSFFTKTISSNTTLSISNCPPDGVTFTLELTVTAGSVTFPHAGIRTPNNVPLTLTTGKVHELMFLTTNGGGRFKLVAANNFDI